MLEAAALVDIGIWLIDRVVIVVGDRRRDLAALSWIFGRW